MVIPSYTNPFQEPEFIAVALDPGTLRAIDQELRRRGKTFGREAFVREAVREHLRAIAERRAPAHQPNPCNALHT